MPRPDRSAERRQELLPVVAAAFAELGYRRASTAELADRCGVRVNILYRLWPDKKAMFLAAIEFVFVRSLATWEARLADGDAADAIDLLRYEATHLGEHGLHRILFAALGETDDEDIRAALAETYGAFVGFIRGHVAAHRGLSPKAGGVAVDDAAWAILGLATAANIGREIGSLTPRARTRLVTDMGELLLDG